MQCHTCPPHWTLPQPPVVLCSCRSLFACTGDQESPQPIIATCWPGRLILFAGLPPICPLQTCRRLIYQSVSGKKKPVNRLKLQLFQSWYFWDLHGPDKKKFNKMGKTRQIVSLRNTTSVLPALPHVTHPIKCWHLSAPDCLTFALRCKPASS